LQLQLIEYHVYVCQGSRLSRGGPHLRQQSRLVLMGVIQHPVFVVPVLDFLERLQQVNNNE
jgi:hypothetical protein